MIHEIDTPTLLVPRGTSERPEAPGLPHLGDVLDLAALERPRWDDLLASIEGPTAAVSFVATALCDILLQPLHEEILRGWGVQFHTGNPGAAGTEHVAAESTKKTFKWPAPATRRTSNEAAIEWVEVKGKETVTFVSVWFGLTLISFGGYGELATPVELEVGDTVRFDVGALVLEIP